MNLLDFATHAELTDNATPAWNAALAAITASISDRTLRMPAGKFHFPMAPDPITCALKLEGEGHVSTTLIRDYDGVGFIKAVGGDEMYGGAGVTFRDFVVDAGQASTGVGIWLQAPLEHLDVPLKGPHSSVIHNVFAVAGHYYPNSGSWAYPFYLDGSLNKSPGPGVARGLRFTTITNCGSSQYLNYPLMLESALAVRIVEFDASVGRTGSSAVIYTIDDDMGTRNYSHISIERH